MEVAKLSAAPNLEVRFDRISSKEVVKLRAGRNSVLINSLDYNLNINFWRGQLSSVVCFFHERHNTLLLFFKDNVETSIYYNSR